MKRHSFDPLSFIFGIAFVAFAGALSVTGFDVDAGVLRWIGAGILLLTGAVMLFGSRSSDEHR